MSTVSLSIAPFLDVASPHNQFQTSYASLKSIEKALSIIKTVGKVLYAVCIVGIWAFPLDYVITSGAAVVMTIPASLFGLPIVFLVCYVANRILNHQKEKHAEICFNHLIQHIHAKGNPRVLTEDFQNEFRRIGSMLTELEISIGENLTLTHELYAFTCESLPQVRELTFDAHYLLKKDFASLFEKIPRLENVTINNCQILAEKDYNFLSHWQKIQCLKLNDAEQINPNSIKKLIHKKVRVIKLSGPHDYIIDIPPRTQTSAGYIGVVPNFPSYSGGGLSGSFAWR